MDAAKARVEVARAELQAYQACVAASEATTNAEELARAAAKAERKAAFLTVQSQWSQAERELAQHRKKTDLAAIKKLEPQVAALKKSLDQAEKNLALTDGKYTPLGPIYPNTSTGRRKALAEWIAARDNPLTARVAVNHIWLRHFDRALVETVFDFGRNAKKPSHPELLDWLAVEFMESGWKMHHLHRLIVTSSTYRMQSTEQSPPHPYPLSPKGRGENVDADNRWYWRANAKRMEAEIVRDSILASAGELDRQVGGMVLENKDEATSKRRGLYFSIFPEDGGHLKFLEIFDAPDPCDCYRRSTSVMPQQALALTNNPLALQQSRVLAGKLSKGIAKDDDFVVAAFEHLLSRPASAKEAMFCREFLQQQVELYRNTNPQELKSGSAPALRARESLIRVLYNHNDFVTVR